MELLRELTRIQNERGWLDDGALRELAARRNVPLYRLQGLVSFYPHFRTNPPPRVHVDVCRDITCAMGGCRPLAESLRSKFSNREDVEICEVSCLGRCDTSPAVAVNDVPVVLRGADDVDTIEQVVNDPGQLPANEPTDSPGRWECDPYDDALKHYETLRTILESGSGLRATCIDRLKQSALRGMGGAGFPTGMKWEFVANESADAKYIICNADESEPGTFKDRVILEELPHLVIEGMVLAALTVGAQRGIIYLRHEYGRERKAMEAAIDRARDLGVLGNDVSSSDRSFDVEIFLSPGGYILGEETALLEALEDKRGEPRNRPPYPGTHGLWGKPTLINNVETFALATAIIHHGAAWWKDQGAGDSAGLKFIAVSGDVEQPGVYEVPLGITVGGLIDRAGGVQGGKLLKAFLPGGASSNFLPAGYRGTPLDFDAMQQAGSMLGSGALIVIAEGRNVFELATNIVTFFRNESCGKCVPCRVGTEKTVAMLEQVAAGKLDTEELKILPELGETLTQTSICGLGQVALNPILSAMKHFPEDMP